MKSFPEPPMNARRALPASRSAPRSLLALVALAGLAVLPALAAADDARPQPAPASSSSSAPSGSWPSGSGSSSASGTAPTPIGPPLSPGCLEAIAPANAQTFFEQLKGFHSSDGCTLGGVSTQADIMRVEWKKAGASRPPVLVRPASCVGETTESGLALVVPAAMSQDCPAAVKKMQEIVESDSFGALVQMPGAPIRQVKQPKSMRGLLARGAAAVLVALLLANWWRLRRKAQRASG